MTGHLDLRLTLPGCLTLHTPLPITLPFTRNTLFWFTRLIYTDCRCTTVGRAERIYYAALYAFTPRVPPHPVITRDYVYTHTTALPRPDSVMLVGWFVYLQRAIPLLRRCYDRRLLLRLALHTVYTRILDSDRIPAWFITGYRCGYVVTLL